jgi:hypothetical protein
VRFLEVAALAAIALSPRPAHACAAFSGREPVPIAREDALIVWDEAKHEEHFIRSAVFDTKQKSVGFLVPTPSPPTFAEAGDAWTAALKTVTAPIVEHRASYVPIGCTMLPFAFMARSMKSATTVAAAQLEGVHVLSETRVAGMDVAVLDATDAGALAKWLAAHDFEMRDALQRWLAPYVAKKWTISAFRYARPDVASSDAFVPPLAARAVRITFKTDAPVYPYREPDDAPPVLGRELHLFVLSASRLAGAESDLANAAWPAPVPFAAKMALPAEVVSSLAGVALPAQLWVNEFVDGIDKRPATDLVFDKLAAAGEVRRPPTIIEDGPRIFIPYELPFVAIFAAWLWRRRRRRVTRP